MTYEFGGMSYDSERNLVAAKVDYWLGGSQLNSGSIVRVTLKTKTDTELVDLYIGDEEMHEGPCTDKRQFVLDGFEAAREDYLGSD